MDKVSQKKRPKTKKRTSKKSNSQNKMQNVLPEPISKEIIGVGVIGLSLLILIGLFVENSGIVGEMIRTTFIGMFGIGGYIIPLSAGLIGIFYIQGNQQRIVKMLGYVGSLVVLITPLFHVISFGEDISAVLLSTYYIKQGSWLNGGLMGAALAYLLLKLIGLYGTYLILIILLGIWLIMVTKFPIFSWISDKIIQCIQFIRESYQVKKQRPRKPKEKKIIIAPAIEEALQAINQEDIEPIQVYDSESYIDSTKEVFNSDLEINHTINTTSSPISPIVVEEEELEQIDVASHTAEDPKEYTFPSIELLSKGQIIHNKDASKKSLSNAKKLEETLESFGVEAKVVQIHRGPSVTRYELQPKQGVKVSKIVNLADDIALNLAAPNIRIEAPIPGKAAVGIEIANDASEIVYLRDVIDTDRFLAFPSKLAFALGKDIAGKPIIADIAKMPHVLIAGATGSGKSVCINTLITSILYKAKPNEVKLIMIDPKVVELNVYNGIPHLLIPVVTDPKKAAGALWWAVNEMTKRYNQFAESNVRDMKGYNDKVADESLKLPQIVIIIDELADLMMTAAKEVEDAICRLAQMARAAGIHLVIATQRPSVDVITGVIKANIPSRLAFAVSSGIDSRTILDTNGAEKLLGKGDMLFNPIGESKPIRIQGAFISDKEVESIVKSVKTEEVTYEESVMQTLETSNIQVNMEEEEDELVEKAIAFTVGKEKLSISMLQRYFRIGFNRAARLMDTLESKGIVGADEGSKPRKVL
ncbi:DNA translocase FtsK [Cellulosilyticum sp. I15G10I2]|uniref:DNA translocase FtsK n=1 Tax=Cellulosilyticum sp. I15G10I2 TaxID=1892843 RepID=UPI0009F3CABE|nr:DNA translocase FtsK [Cellulosilyticum sp. I15G10I2]